MTEKGPPPVGTSGWLAHIDTPQLMLSSMNYATEEGGPRLIGQFAEGVGYGGTGEFRLPRNPTGAAVIDGRGESIATCPTEDDAVRLDFAAGEIPRLKVDFAG